MAKSIDKKASQPAKKGSPYLTKRALERAVSKGTRHTSDEAISKRGHIVTTKDGWVVKVNSNGTEEKISKLPVTKKITRIVLD
jgi:hypothetical protein